jgi:hypothetical protein
MAYKMLINGKLVDGAMTLDVFNPATGGVLATCPRADEAQLDEAVAAAKAAFPAWSALSFSERRKRTPEGTRGDRRSAGDAHERVRTAAAGTGQADRAGDRGGHGRSRRHALLRRGRDRDENYPRDRGGADT